VHLTFWQGVQVKVKASQVCPDGQLPQASFAPQPSGRLPQRPLHVLGSQVVQRLFRHFVPAGQVLPHAKLLPQTSEMNPHASELVHNVSWATQALLPALHTCPCAQRPQWRMPPQPSL
jgi:hypothetical protein